jgi:hypothetical protein
MHKAASFICLIVCAVILFMPALALQDNITAIKEGLSVLNNTAMNNTAANSTATSVAAINNTASINTSVNEYIRAGNNTVVNSSIPNENRATTKENNTSVGQNNTTSKQMSKMQSSSVYDIDMNSNIKPMYNIGAYSHIKGLFHVGTKSESGAFNIGTTAKPGLEIAENASLVHTFGLGSLAKSMVDAAKQPFLCNIV